MRALVIGATGFIGGAIARAAVERGWTVRAARRNERSAGALGDLADDGRFEWRHVDLNAVDTLVNAMEGCDAVFHAAGYYPTSSRAAGAQIHAARTQMETVLEAFERAHSGRLVYTSSLSTIGRPGGPGRLANETDVYRAGSVPVLYFDIKIAMEEVALASGLPVVALCPTGVFGPGDVKPTSGQALMMVARGLAFFYMDGVQDVVDVRDVAATHLVAVEKGVTGQRYIIGGEQMSYHEMLTVMARAAGRRPPWLRIPVGVVAGAGAVAGQLGILGGDVLQAIRYWQPLDTSRARRELGHASRPFADTVRDAVAWFRQHGYL
jgi:dihydroflavonol-4-reductase